MFRIVYNTPVALISRHGFGCIYLINKKNTTQNKIRQDIRKNNNAQHRFALVPRIRKA